MGLSYLYDEVTEYVCDNCGYIAPSFDYEWDEYSSAPICPSCSNQTHDNTQRIRKPTFWSVAMYEEGQAYGGPEEGGWWYRYGNLVNPEKVRVFEDYAEAVAYHASLWDVAERENKENRYCETRLIAVGYTEAFPDAYFPKQRPHYS